MTPVAPAALTTAAVVHAALVDLSDESKASQVARYLRAVPGGYGEGDRFMGVAVPRIRALAKRTRLDHDELERLAASPWHEERMVALCVAVGRAKRIRRLLDSARSQRDSNSPAVQDALTGREEMGLRYLDWVVGAW